MEKIQSLGLGQLIMIMLRGRDWTAGGLAARGIRCHTSCNLAIALSIWQMAGLPAFGRHLVDRALAVASVGR
ncbi:hypothetical protein DN412_36055 [Cupriavidus lacunae]|uniref:Uncharacterized protein n=1 Tax=Cupriavidus lacunae TaxID=2666307 RepID=A0A370NJ15_9BURK|nr:hypothetical protein DN412_36055 [Cupriavidus lacunae]